MQVLSVASEVYPLVKTGGLADVVGALPAALKNEQVDVRTLVPGYPAVLDRLHSAEPAHFLSLFGGPARLLVAEASGLDLIVLDAPHLYHRPGNPYSDRNGQDWPDNAQRFAALGQVAAELGRGALSGCLPDIVHAHDWQAGLAAAYLHYGGSNRRPGTVMTVHNLAFQGNFRADMLSALGLPAQAFTIEGVEFFGRIGFLKAGLQLSGRITTVSPTYAQEIATPEAGMGLDGLLRARSAFASGILNGIDRVVWDPAADTHLAENFTVDSLDRRQANTRALQDRFGLSSDPQGMLFGVVSRLSWQKGLDLLLAALPKLLSCGASLILLGSGDAELENAFRAAASAAPGRIATFIGYDEALAHLIQGGADALLVPSRFEPCGLTQLCAMRYGCVPVGARVGGLNDTIVDANEMALAAGVATGFQFAPVTREGLEAAIGRALAAWSDETAWRQIQTNGMNADVGWDRPAKRYASLYRELLTER